MKELIKCMDFVLPATLELSCNLRLPVSIHCEGGERMHRQMVCFLFDEEPYIKGRWLRTSNSSSELGCPCTLVSVGMVSDA